MAGTLHGATQPPLTRAHGGRDPASRALTAAVAATLGRVARRRDGAAVHEVGTAYDARLRVDVGGPISALPPGEIPVTVRISRGAGLPSALPDVWGLGLRIAADDGVQDLLVDSCVAAGPLGRHLPRPRRDLLGGPFGSLLALRAGGGAFHLGLFPHRGRRTVDHGEAAGLVCTVAWAPPSGPWRAWGGLRLDRRADDQAVRLTPTHDALGVGLDPWWARLRARGYAASRAAHPGVG